MVKNYHWKGYNLSEDILQDCLYCIKSTKKKEEPCAGCGNWHYINKNFTGKENELSRIIMRYINEGV